MLGALRECWRATKMAIVHRLQGDLPDARQGFVSDETVSGESFSNACAVIDG
jgi:hypothetical protein